MIPFGITAVTQPSMVAKATTTSTLPAAHLTSRLTAAPAVIRSGAGAVTLAWTAATAMITFIPTVKDQPSLAEQVMIQSLMTISTLQFQAARATIPSLTPTMVTTPQLMAAQAMIQSQLLPMVTTMSLITPVATAMISFMASAAIIPSTSQVVLIQLRLAAVM